GKLQVSFHVARKSRGGQERSGTHAPDLPRRSMTSKLFAGERVRADPLMTAPKLQHELKKKRPFESPEQEAALNVWRTSDQLQIQFARLLREYGLTPSQYNILRILRGEGEPLPIL